MTVSHGPTVRTYRGRSLEELIPRIREELGPDAIILREREGLTGGINGFFAQRCVEVDAQAPAGVDFYDEEDEVLPDADSELADASPVDPVPPYAHAAAHYAQSGVAAVEPELAAAAEPEPFAVAEPKPVAVAEPIAVAEPEPTPPLAEELSFAQRLEQARREREAEVVPAPADEAGPAAEPALRAPTPTPYPTGPRTKLKVRPKPARTFPAPALVPAAEPGPAPAATHATAQLDSAAAGAVARELIGHGISEAWAHELIVAAAAHLTPFADHDGLREAVRAGVAASISGTPLLPSSGAAVAFVGAGGSGKTRCAAALAARYAHASTLQVSVVTLSAGSEPGDIATLLNGRGVEVRPLAGEAAADAVARGRERGLVVIDTPATSPVDADGVAALADELGQAGLDGVYLTVPATLSASAARSLLDGLAPVGVTTLVITHADETEDLGIAAELAYQTGLPIAFIHGGLDLDRALTIADPATVAARVLGELAGATSPGSSVGGTPAYGGTDG